ncbi:G-protein coupled receptor daf-37 [Taenia crassiceps]|uniref:G-protein coupled receptor daf-37 n=1 Tax=Taenia crassiceps TaxID=6207 RepID=A0ABR4QPP6_9CEST
MLNVTNSPNVYRRYPDGLLIKRFLPEVFELKLYASPIWFVVGLIGNLISFFIWVSQRQRGKNSSAVYLATLALTDLLLIICLFTEYLRLYLFLSSLISVNGMCQLFQGVFLFLQYYSIVLTFGFTLERWIAICYPFKRQKLCSTTRALVGVSVLAIIVACFSIFFASTWEVVDGACILANRWQNDTTFPIYLSTTECIFSLIVPIATLVFNILVLREIGHLVKSKLLVSRENSSTHHASIVRRLHRSQNSQHHQQVASTRTTEQSAEPLVLGAKHSSAHASAKEQANFQAVTLMLVILSFYLILCTLPVGIVFVVQMRFTDIPDDITDEEILVNPAWQQYLRFLTAKEIIDFLCSSHYACNFIIYILTGKSFRQHLKDILLCRLQQTRTEMTSVHHPKATCMREKIKRVDKLISKEKEEGQNCNHQDPNCHATKRGA